MKTGFVRQNDFDFNHVDWSRNGYPILHKKKTTTLLEYHQAAQKGSPAGQYIDEGLEPYVVDWMAYEDGMWPWVLIEDVEKSLTPDGKVVVYFPEGCHVLPGDTIVFWR